jgi:error-prone DNA polymerase
MTDYVELHARSAFSFLEGATMPEFLMQQAAHLEMPAMALLDRNGLYGAARFHMEGTRCGVRAHIGAEVALSDLGQRLQPAPYLPHQLPAEPVRLPLLAESRLGYQNLSRMLTQFKLRETTKAEGAAAVADVEEYSKGVVCLTGGTEGPLAAALARGGYDLAYQAVERLVRLFGSGNVYVELQRHFDREEEHRNRAAIRIARSLNLPLLATGGVSYGTPYEREVLDIFTCIRHRKTLDTAGRLLSRNAERHLHTAAEMHRLFYDYPEAIANTCELSDRLQFQMTGLGYEFPAYPVPDGETMDSFLRKRVDEGMRRRYLPKNDGALYEKAKRQAERELRLIEKLGLAGYFLIVWDVVCFCKNNGILIQGRGSAANSVVCYALEITIVDSVGLDLLFERFLSEERGEWPDIDLDLPSDTDRERAIQYVYQRYGELGAAMTANVITFRSRSASREVGKALGFDQETAAKLASLMSAWEWKAPSDTLENSFKAAGLDMKHRRIAHYLQKCGDVLRLPRNLGQHSGGMVICQGHLDSVVPIERATMPGRTVVQWDKDDCSDMGIIKVDLLGLGMLAVLKDAAYLVPQYYGEQLDYAQLPQDDAVYESIQEADTVGLFQIESRAQMSALPRTKPKCFADLSMQVAIIRPGPVTGKFVNPYIARRLGREPVTYLHPSFKSFLERTLGVPLFQEQVMKIGMVAANLTGGEAEELRKAMGGKRSESIIAGLKTRLHEGMTANGFNAAAQEEVMRVLATVSPAVEQSQTELNETMLLKDRLAQAHLLNERLGALRAERSQIATSTWKRGSVAEATKLHSTDATEAFSLAVESLLDSWKYPDLQRVTFDDGTHDLIISGKERGSEGKGFRAVAYAAYIIGLLNYSLNSEAPRPHPGFVVLDSPLVTYKRRDTAPGDEVVPDDVVTAFYASLASLSMDRQIIVLENNDPPEILHDTFQYLHFSRSSVGRYGFFPMK